MDEELLRRALIDVVKYSVVEDESPPEVAEVGIRLGRRRAELMQRDLEWWIDIPIPLIYLCWWWWKPEASPEVRERIVTARQKIIAEQGYDALWLSDELLVTNPFAVLGDAEVPRYATLRAQTLDMTAEPALSDGLLLSNLPFERYGAPEYRRLFGVPFDITKL